MPALVDTPAPYRTRLTTTAAIIEARRILDALAPVRDALDAMHPDDDAEYLSSAGRDMLRSMQLHAEQAEIAYHREEWDSARRHLEHVLTRWNELRQYPEIACILDDLEGEP